MATLCEQYSIVSLIEKVGDWHHERNLIEGSTDKDQYMKLIQEAGELSDNICKGKDIADDIGDMLVVLINIAERNDLTLTECLTQAWNDIKDRKGRMVDGVFVKEEDETQGDFYVEDEDGFYHTIDDWMDVPSVAKEEDLDEETEVVFWLKGGQRYDLDPDEANPEEEHHYRLMQKSWLEN